jgi:hypothetical protein
MPPPPVFSRGDISSPVPAAKQRVEASLELYEEDNSGDIVPMYYGSSESLVSGSSFVEEGTPEHGESKASPWPYSRMVNMKTSDSIFKPLRILDFRHGDWWYTKARKDGRIQVFGDFPVIPGRASLDHVTTRDIPTLPHVIDPPPSSNAFRGKSDQPTRRQLGNWNAAITRYRRRARSPCHLTSSGRWNYDLKDGRRQVFPGNTKEAMKLDIVAQVFTIYVSVDLSRFSLTLTSPRISSPRGHMNGSPKQTSKRFNLRVAGVGVAFALLQTQLILFSLWCHFCYFGLLSTL